MTEQTQPQPNIVSFSRLLDLAMRILAQRAAWAQQKEPEIVTEELLEKVLNWSRKMAG